MTKTDFIIECAMRVAAAAGDVTPEYCINRAQKLADALEKEGYLKK